MPRVFIGVPMIGHVHPQAYLSHLSLSKPPGTAIAGVVRSMPDYARNSLVEQALKFGYDYIFFLDDDMVPEPDLLVHLLKIMESDSSISVLSPFAYRRLPPYLPCVFRLRQDGKYDPIDSRDEGIIDVDATTMASTLVRSSVFRSVSFPWFEFKDGGEIRFSEDITFCRKVKEAGLRICVDTNRECLHISDNLLVGRDLYEAHSRLTRETTRRIIVHQP